MKALLRSFALVVVALAYTSAQAAPAANLLPNSSFERGQVEPDSWSAFALHGSSWEHHAQDGERCVSVTGDGSDSAWWSVAGPVDVQPNRLYHFSYWVRRAPEARGGVAVAGLDWVSRDTMPRSEWEERSFYFRTPEAVLSGVPFRVGQWHVKGKVFFDKLSLLPALSVQRRPAQLQLPLGSGEKVLAGSYTASHPLAGEGATDWRCLERFNARFNSNRWVFSGPAEVIYRHQVGRLRQAEAEVEVAINWWEAGALLIEASQDGEQWSKLGEMSAVSQAALPLPSEMLPARQLWVRLRSTDGVSLQVDSYQYRSRLLEGSGVKAAVGATHYVTLIHSESDLEVEVADLGGLLPAEAARMDLVLKTAGPRRAVQVQAVIKQGDDLVSHSQQRVSLASGVPQRIGLSYTLEASGEYGLTITCTDVASGGLLWEGRCQFTVAALYDARGGELISEDADLAVWWCEPERKVAQSRPAPTSRGAALRISAAANEYEAAQLVLTPRSRLLGCRLRASDLVADSGARIPASEIEIREVEYLLVVHPTDRLGTPGNWPDPLPRHDAPTDLSADSSHPFWITVHVPAGTPAGEYRGEVGITADGVSSQVPLLVRVRGFDLPRETHVRSGFGLSSWWIKRYHNLETDEELRQVRDLYLRDFAAHRVAPYTFGRPIQVEWEKSPLGGLQPKLHVWDFDEDARFALDELGFNSFMVNLEGLGGGTYHSRRLGEIEDLKQGTREHEQAFTRYLRTLQNYLEVRGWLDKAYVYWFDEPEQKDYEFVRQGMELIHRAGPKLTRMLTEQPTPELYGAVDLWCLSTPALDPQAVEERQRAGEEVWWYLCTGPKAPYFTLFLDHYGTEMRLWLWETWKHGLDGILVWQTNYWSSGAAYPEPALQNPWEDPMSWTSGYSTAAGVKHPWGNGDGRFLYPPNRDPLHDKTKYLEGPVPSIRWELLRDGIEDYEYFWLLKQEIERLKASGTDPSVYREAERLLEVPSDICADLTHFTTTPKPIHQHRAKLAEAIERLRRYSSDRPAA
jgi:hypothetical protein